MKILKLTLIALFLGLCSMLSGCDGHFKGPSYYSEYENWDVTNFGRGGDYTCDVIAIGPLKNDGKDRIYLFQHSLECDNHVLEYSFEQGNWQEKEIYTHPSMGATGIIGQGRNDGIDRIYIAYSFGSSICTLLELTYSNNSWKIINIDSSSAIGLGLTIGPGRNDGIHRIYCVSSNGYILEYTFLNNKWENTEVGPAGESSINAISIGTARNDGVRRVYAASNNGHIYELSYTGSSWDITDLGTIKSESYGNDVYITIGQGRSDGMERVYASVEHISTIYEFSYTEGNWEMDSTDVEYGGAGLAVGTGRNDGIFRIYRTGSWGHLQESSYLDNKWQLSADLRGGSYFVGVAIGAGRGDDINRIYGICNDGYAYEFSYQQ